MAALARDSRLSEWDHVVAGWDFVFDSSVEVFVLKKNHRVMVADRRFDEPLGIIGRCRTNHLQSRSVHKPHLRVLRMEWAAMHVSPTRTAEHERSRRSPTVVRRGDHVDDLVEGAPDEVHELEFGYRPQSGKSGAEGCAYDRRFRNRRVDDALRTKAVDEAVGDFERSAVNSNVLAQAKNALVAFHLLPDSLADRFEIGDSGHEDEV